ncbi:MAG: hypothetical protein HOW73_19700 [Polyangiaceae bacterium]|nr:hypothetical protein [Polyangiaceae bacterium]
MRSSVPERGLWLAIVASVAVGLSTLSTGVGCDDGSGGSGASGGGDACATEVDDRGCFNYECFEAPQAEVSFRTDVLPIFEQSCSLSSSCHGNPTSPDTPSGYQPYLGEVNQDETPSDVALILETIVSKPSHVSSMNIVDPGKPESSFLMHKMDDDLDCADLGCDGGDCGDSMPQGTSPLPRETRDVVRAWIQQGAKDN